MLQGEHYDYQVAKYWSTGKCWVWFVNTYQQHPELREGHSVHLPAPLGGVCKWPSPKFRERVNPED